MSDQKKQLDQAILDLKKLESEIWDAIKSRSVYDPNLHAIYERLQKTLNDMRGTDLK